MRSISTNNDHLFTSISSGDEQAFGELFFAYKDFVYSSALFYTKDHSDAEEIVQEVFSRIWKYRERLSEVNEFTAWIRTVIRNRSLSALKKKATEEKQKKELFGYFTREIENTEQGMKEKELQALLKEAMTKLSPQQCKIFELSTVQGMDRNTVAQLLGLSSKTVSNHLTIALRTIRSFLHEHKYVITLYILLARLFFL